jgi:PAS domain S-box-containing protein
MRRRSGRRHTTARKAGRNRVAEAPATRELPDLLDLFTRTTDGVMAVDPACRVILWNSAAEAMLGYAASEVLGRACHDVVQGHDSVGNLFCHPHCAVMTMARRDELANAYCITTRTKEGAERRLNVSTVLVPGVCGNIVVHLFRDMTAAGIAPIVDAVGSGDGVQAPVPATDGIGQLTAREREILCLMARGEGTQAIARRLFISTATVRNHTQRILMKCAVHSRLEAVALAFRTGVNLA